MDLLQSPIQLQLGWCLRKSYIAYAWNARGDGLSGEATNSGWRLFGERLDQAESTLQQAKVLKTKCPEWYVAMQDVALGKGWGRGQSDGITEGRDRI